MLLATDIGNSDIVLGISGNDCWLHTWRIPTLPDLPETAYLSRISDLFLENSLKATDVEQVILSSVVPGLTEKIRNVLTVFLGKAPVVMAPELYQRLPLILNNPYEIGSDLVANALAAFTRYRQPCLIVDFGTALTFTAVSGNGHVLGVAIAPGLKTAIKSLSQNTARLFEVPLEMPPSPLGNNTVTAIQAGILMGYEGMVRFMITRILQEMKADGKVVATGGLSAVITPLQDVFDVIDPHLTLDGLKIAASYA